MVDLDHVGPGGGQDDQPEDNGRGNRRRQAPREQKTQAAGTGWRAAESLTGNGGAKALG